MNSLIPKYNNIQLFNCLKISKFQYQMYTYTFNFLEEMINLNLSKNFRISDAKNRIKTFKFQNI